MRESIEKKIVDGIHKLAEVVDGCMTSISCLPTKSKCWMGFTTSVSSHIKLFYSFSNYKYLNLHFNPKNMFLD